MIMQKIELGNGTIIFNFDNNFLDNFIRILILIYKKTTKKLQLILVS